MVTEGSAAAGYPRIFMSDPLYLSLWFPDFSGPAMLPHMFAVLQQFPFSEQRPGITYAAVQPVSWNEASVLERRFSPGIAPEEAVVVAADLIHDDYAYVFDAYWDLWTPDPGGHEWLLIPSLVKFIVQGEEFDDGTYQETGHLEIDFGLDSLFVQENIELTEQTQAKIYARHLAPAVVGIGRESSSETHRASAESAVTAEGPPVHRDRDLLCAPPCPLWFKVLLRSSAFDL
jgi:hypothetical protein